MWKNRIRNKKEPFRAEKEQKRTGNPRMERRLFFLSVILMIVSLLLQLSARKAKGFAEWYAGRVYPLIVGSIGRISGLLPFSVIEIAVDLLLIVSFCYVLLNLRRWKVLLNRAVFLLSVVFFLFTVNCGINYYRKPFSAYSNLPISDSTKEELVSLCETLTDEVNQLSEAGVTAQVSVREANREGVRAMKKLGDEYPQLSGYYPRPKALLFSYVFSVQQLCGQYSPFTVEANYNRDMPAYNIPHTICHELSHLRGFMREDEANFIGYLACIGSDNASYRYSGYLSGWVYATNALAKTDFDAYQTICKQLNEQAWADLMENNKFWANYNGKTAKVSNQLNDAYLKMNSQSDGVKSYGRVVELMLAYQRKGDA